MVLMDIAIPSGNEEEFLSWAKKLGTSLRFLYSTTQEAATQAKKGYQVGVLSTNPNELRRAVQQKIFSVSTSNDIAVVEMGPSLLIEMERLDYKDSLHARRSGLNQVLLKLMKKKGTALGVSFSLLLNAPQRQRSQLLGRMQQNMRLARKYEVSVEILSCAKKPSELRPHVGILKEIL